MSLSPVCSAAAAAPSFAVFPVAATSPASTVLAAPQIAGLYRESRALIYSLRSFLANQGAEYDEGRGVKKEPGQARSGINGFSGTATSSLVVTVLAPFLPPLVHTCDILCRVVPCCGGSGGEKEEEKESRRGIHGDRP